MLVYIVDWSYVSPYFLFLLTRMSHRLLKNQEKLADMDSKATSSEIKFMKDLKIDLDTSSASP